jgi:hypothetical protein
LDERPVGRLTWSNVAWSMRRISAVRSDVTVHRVDVDVQGETSGPRVAARAQDVGGLQAAEPGVRGTDFDGAVLPVELDISVHLALEPCQEIRIRTVEDRFADTGDHDPISNPNAWPTNSFDVAR